MSRRRVPRDKYGLLTADEIRSLRGASRSWAGFFQSSGLSAFASGVLADAGG